MKKIVEHAPLIYVIRYKFKTIYYRTKPMYNYDYHLVGFDKGYSKFTLFSCVFHCSLSNIAHDQQLSKNLIIY